MRVSITSAALIASLICTQAVAATYIQAGKLIPADSDKVMSEVTVVVEGDKISEILQGYIAGGGQDEVLDLKTHTLMPGLMDMHTHVTSQHNGPASYMERFTLNEADYAIKGVQYAKRTLLAGFTTIRNLGDGYNESVALRNAINKGIVEGPRIFTAAKSIATTGGTLIPLTALRRKFRVIRVQMRAS